MQHMLSLIYTPGEVRSVDMSSLFRLDALCTSYIHVFPKTKTVSISLPQVALVFSVCGFLFNLVVLGIVVDNVRAMVNNYDKVTRVHSPCVLDRYSDGH